MRYWIFLLGLFALLPATYGAVLVNMTFDTADGFYNTSHSENLGLGLDFLVRGADYNLSYRTFDGYYTTGTSKYLNATSFRTISEDGKHASQFFWVRGTTGFTGMGLTHWNTATGARGESSEFDGDSRFKVLLSQESLGTNKSYLSSIELDDGVWHFVGWVWNDGGLTLYIDGVNDTAVTKTTDHAMSKINASTYQVLLGARGNAGNPAGFPNARFDNVLIFNTSLTPAEVSALYSSLAPQYGRNTFYFSNSGNDSSLTCSLSAPCRSITKYNSILTSTILAGDNISFKCNDTWRLTNDSYMTFKSGADGAPITYRNYCPGDPTLASSDKPRFLGSFNASNTSHWVNVAGNVWKSAYNYTYDIGNIVFNAGASNGQKKDYYLNMTTQGDFYKWNYTHTQLYLYSVGNPATVYDTIELVNKSSIMYITSQDYITFDGLDLWYGGTHGIVTTGNNVEIHIKNTDLWWMGGAYQGKSFGYLRLGNCQEYGLQGINMSVTNTRAFHCFDACYSTQAWLSGGDNKIIRNHNYSYNLGAYCSYGFEYFSSATHSTTESFVVEHNTFVYLGRNNFGTNTGRIRNDRSPINTTDFIFRNNIIAYTDFRTIDFADGQDWYGDYSQDYNLHFNSTGTNLIYFNGTHYPTLAAFKTAHPGYEAHGIESDPLFVDSDGLNFLPYSDSPACTMSSSGSFVGAYSCYSFPAPVPPLSPNEEYAAGMQDSLGVIVSFFSLIVTIVVLGIVISMFAVGKIDGDQFLTLVIILVTTGILCGVGALIFSALGNVG